MNSPRETSPSKGAQPKPHKRVGRGTTPTGRRDDSADVTTRLPRIGEDGRVADPTGQAQRAGSRAFSLPHPKRRAKPTPRREAAPARAKGQGAGPAEGRDAKGAAAGETAAGAADDEKAAPTEGAARGGKAALTEKAARAERATRAERAAAADKVADATAATDGASGTDGGADPSEAEEARERRRAEAARPRRSVAEVVRSVPARCAGFARRHVRGLIALAVALALVASVWGPLGDYYVAWRRSGELAESYAEISAENDGLSQDIDRLQTREGVEDEARRQGYAYEGESTATSQSAQDDPNQGPDPTNPEPSEPTERPWYIVVLDALFCYQPLS